MINTTSPSSPLFRRIRFLTYVLTTEAEYQIVKTHALEGYNLLKDLSINEHIKNSALMHHERCDGTGYPEGVKADQIDEYAKIVAIADVYDAMTSARIYSNIWMQFGLFFSKVSVSVIRLSILMATFFLITRSLRIL